MCRYLNLNCLRKVEFNIWIMTFVRFSICWSSYNLVYIFQLLNCLVYKFSYDLFCLLTIFSRLAHYCIKLCTHWIENVRLSIYCFAKIKLFPITYDKNTRLKRVSFLFWKIRLIHALCGGVFFRIIRRLLRVTLASLRKMPIDVVAHRPHSAQMVRTPQDSA